MHPEKLAAARALVADLRQKQAQAAAVLERLAARVDLAEVFPDHFPGPLRVTVDSSTATVENPETGARDSRPLRDMPPAAALAAIALACNLTDQDRARLRPRYAPRYAPRPARPDQ